MVEDMEQAITSVDTQHLYERRRSPGQLSH